jgi:hypothetical protein
MPVGDHPEPDQRARLTVKLAAACQEFRRWARGHPDEFALLFSMPLPAAEEAGAEIVRRSVLEFAGTFYAMFVELWNTLPFPVPGPAEIPPGFGGQFTWVRDQLPGTAPGGMIVVFMHCWMLLYGAVSAEIFGHAAVVLDDADTMFEFVLGDLARQVGLEYPLPVSQ